ncbi:SPOSA6832_02902 [Sporobolomyces salmonicolor]|uniref:SPOSA6832_02902-mRNA-1:cds n=1 Tax=Sporidiobolus salmonicolor TaxID=5005 RepID=A0A0D6ENQ0_SPOSA|nr:SPOSA6832_02902 [Sporobolomyces salmonicolor]
MASSNWPPDLKQFVNETFAKCTDANRAAVEAELKRAIYTAFSKNELWTTDWKNLKLERGAIIRAMLTLAAAGVSSRDSLHPGKKRKAFVPSTPASYGVTPHPGTEDARREERAKRFKQQNGGEDGVAGSLASRMGSGGRLVQGGVHSYGVYSGSATPELEAVYDPNVIDWDQHTIVGTSTKLEKPYLRLTSVRTITLAARSVSLTCLPLQLPDPKTIRPLAVLKETLNLLKNKWREESNYNYICDQFKSMRQDLIVRMRLLVCRCSQTNIVQRITNDFTVQVYEIHARIALEKGDLGEFNQCQSRLRHLYRQGLNGHPLEFLGYRILYLLFSRNRAELNTTLAELTPEETRDISVSHALAVRHAVSQGNYTKFFRLFNAAPKMGAYVMDHFVPRERVTALVTMCKAYLQIPLTLVTSQLSFDSDQEAHDFLAAHNAAVYKPPPKDEGGRELQPQLGDQQLDCKKALPTLSEVLGKMQKADLKGQI